MPVQPDTLKLLKKHINKANGGTIGLILALVVLGYPYVKPKLDKLDSIDKKVESHDVVIQQTLPSINQHLSNLDTQVNQITDALLPGRVRRTAAATPPTSPASSE